jgi:hypothetical protein
MRRLPSHEPLLLVLLLLVSAGKGSAASQDQKLLSLVPPGAQSVARIGALSRGVDHFVLMTHNNKIDLNDLVALTGADSTRVIHELILVAAADDTGALNEHSLLAGGNFDRENIFRSAVDGGASVTRYRGLSVLVVQPFARERGEFNEVRWLAIPASDILLFGSIASAQQELDRYMAGRAPDPNLVARLARLRLDDETWTVLSLLTWTPEIRSALAAIDPNLAERLKSGDALQFGIHYGKQVEFEYEVTTASAAGAQTISDSLTQSLAGLEEGSAPLLPAGSIIDGNTARGAFKISIRRYLDWLAEVSARGRAHNTAAP